jgi:hypothetical protein
MRVLDHSVPSENGGFLAAPPVAEWLGMLAEQVEREAGWQGEIAGVPLPAMRDRARADVLALARDYSAGVLGVDAPASPSSGPICVTGHQPTFFHPGIWIKNLLTDDLARSAGGVGLNVIVDSDSAAGMCVNYPLRDAAGDLKVGSACPLGADEARPFESLAAPPAAGWDGWQDVVASGLASLEADEVIQAFESWRAASAATGDASSGPGSSVGDVMARARRRYESALGTSYLEVPVSRLADTDAFLLFLLDLCGRAPRFREDYNTALGAYRKMREIRNPANPFSDLALDGDFIEMPFWLIAPDGQRESLWVARRGGELTVMCGSCDVVHLPLGRPEDALRKMRAEGVAARPKALTLTMFLRLLVADFFLHGVGGGKYDAITDDVIASTYGLTPPSYAVASMTFLLEVGAVPPPKERIAELEQRLAALKHNPDRLLMERPEMDGEACELIRRKRELVGAIALPGAPKKELGAKIRDVNDLLQAHVEPLAAEAQRELADLRERTVQAEVSLYREYAYCLFEPGHVRRLLDEAVAAQGEA